MPGRRGFLEKLRRNMEQRHLRLAHSLREARENLGLTQAEVAEVLGQYQSNISKMETGDLMPNVVELENFALMCGKTLNDFATWHEQCEEDSAKASLALGDDEFQRQVAEVRRRKNTRRYYARRKEPPEPPAPPTESALRPVAHSTSGPSLQGAYKDFQEKNGG
jgi:transcriptional regulator with XRE-family HTH domain